MSMHQPSSASRTLSITLKNPITHAEVDRLVQIITHTKDRLFLLVNFGQHEFTSLAVLRYCKEELSRVADIVEQFHKIAFVSAPAYHGIDQDQLRYFHEERWAYDWFAMGINGKF